MKLLLIGLLFPLIAAAQNDRPDTVQIKLMCGFAGISSKEIYECQKLHKAKNYTLIRKNLLHENRLMQILSTMLVLDYESKKLITITNEERIDIDRITNSTQHYSLCFTCTHHTVNTLKQLFSTQDKRSDREIILTNLRRDY